ncbi:ABC transporter permease [Rosenbergiella australiborealis]|uniref:ABC transporter permease n=1 Tax=Rosenbergiella australiborealis TaxID=1544696 RepID=A0ABS5T5E4_9GAMM|nr:ABC transporter permease [Rosenbergiella australiborealis]MBT0726662.1 ABC transporter permease [Rosenbergiella australiborealis]
MSSYWSTFKKVLAGMLEKPMWAMLLLSLCIISMVYAKGSVWEMPIGVVDLDHSSASHLLIRNLNASPKLSIVSYDQLDQAQHDMGYRKLFAVIEIPVDFEKKMLSGISVAIPVFGDATNRLPNGQIQQNVLAAYQQMLTQYEVELMMKNQFTPSQASVVLSPMTGLTLPLFNPGISFAAIIFPGLLVMLLQHSLLIASVRVCLMMSSGGRPKVSVVLGALSALVPIWLFLSIVLFALWPWVLGYKQAASIPEILLMTFPFLLAVLGLGRLLTECIRRVEMVYLTLSFITTPVFYISGTIWPLQAMPAPVRFISSMFPSTWAIKAIAGVNQMGLSLREALPDICMLLLLFVFYSLLSLILTVLRDRRLLSKLVHRGTHH